MLVPDQKNRAPTAQDAKGRSAGGVSHDRWLELADQAYNNSTNYIDENYRKQWEDSLRTFNNQHPTDSKYSQPAYEKRSRIFRPRIRAVIRKNEAAAAAAFFSNMDVVSVTAQDESNKVELASADIMKEVLQYRLTKAIPWFQVVLGGLQDAQTVGVACAHIHWNYEEEALEAPEFDNEDLESEAPKQAEGTLPTGAFVAGEEPKP